MESWLKWVLGIAFGVALGIWGFQTCSRRARAATPPEPAPFDMLSPIASRRSAWAFPSPPETHDRVRCYVPFPRRAESLLNLTCDPPSSP